MTNSIALPTRRERAATIFDLVASIWTPSPRLAPAAWAADNRVYPPTSGVPGPRDPYLTPYFVPFTDAVHAGGYKRYAAACGAQMGKTDSVLDLIGARLDQRPVPMLYVGPTKEFLTDQFEPRLMSLLDEAKSLAGKVARGRVMKKTLKRVAGVPVRLAHAGSSSALKSDPAGLAFVDEYDEMLGDVRKQGDALGLVEARGDTYADFAAVVTSTPSRGLLVTERDPVSKLDFWRVEDGVEIESAIWKLFMEGTRYHWTWPCPHCGEYFVPRFKLLRWPNATPAAAGRAAYIECPNNGCVIRDESKAEMNERGLYVAPGQSIVDGGVVGDPPDTSTYSVWISGLASPFVTWGTRVEKYLAAVASGDPDRVQTAMNAGFGELYHLVGAGDVPEWQEILERRVAIAPRRMPANAFRLVMGVDVQKFSLIYVIRAFGPRATSWLVDYGQLYGPTDQEDVWSALEELMLEPIDGMHVERVGIDSGFRPDKPDQGNEHKVYEFCRRWRWLCMPTKGKLIQLPPYRVSRIEVKPDGKKATYSIDLAVLSTDFFKSLVLSRLRVPADAAGAMLCHKDTGEDYARQVVSEVRIVGKGGKPEWIPLSRSNHFLDCEAIAAAVAYSLNVQRLPDEEAAGDGEGGPDRSARRRSTPTPAPIATDDDDDDPPPGPRRNRFGHMAARLNSR